MIELLERADPAAGVVIDQHSLRAKIDEKTGVIAPLRPDTPQKRPLWLLAAASFVVVAALFLPSALRQESIFEIPLGGIDAPGIEAVIGLTIGGVKTMAVEGETIWVVESLGPTLDRIDAVSGTLLRSYPIDRYVEGVTAGGGYVWLLSYENGGEVLRFDPATEAVDAVTPLGGLPASAPIWFADRLWVSNDRGELINIDSDGLVVSKEPGELKGEGLGHLWVQDPEAGILHSMTGSGARGEVAIPAAHSVREVSEAGGSLWTMEGAFPQGRTVSRYDPATGEVTEVEVGPGLHGMIEYEDDLWVILHNDHTLVGVDSNSLQLTRYPLPGKPGQMVIADGSLWEVLFHPAALLRLDPARLVKGGEVVAEETGGEGHRLLCTAPDTPVPDSPTVILEPFDWIDYGSWAVVQAHLNAAGLTACVNGFLDQEAMPAERALNLQRALVNAGIPGPYVLVGNGDGVHALRIFAQGRTDIASVIQGRTDIAGVVLADPMPVGFQDAYADLLPGEFGEGHPPWLDLPRDISDALADFGEIPLIVIGQDPGAVFLSQGFVDSVGSEPAARVNDLWQSGLEFYAALSTNSETIVANGDGMEVMYWDHPELIVEQVVEMVGR